MYLHSEIIYSSVLLVEAKSTVPTLLTHTASLLTDRSLHFASEQNWGTANWTFSTVTVITHQKLTSKAKTWSFSAVSTTFTVKEQFPLTPSNTMMVNKISINLHQRHFVLISLQKHKLPLEEVKGWRRIHFYSCQLNFNQTIYTLISNTQYIAYLCVQ